MPEGRILTFLCFLGQLQDADTTGGHLVAIDKAGESAVEGRNDALVHEFGRVDEANTVSVLGEEREEEARAVVARLFAEHEPRRREA